MRETMSSQAHEILDQLREQAFLDTIQSDAKVEGPILCLASWCCTHQLRSCSIPESLKSAGLMGAGLARGGLNKSSSQDCCSTSVKIPIGIPAAARPQSVPPHSITAAAAAAGGGPAVDAPLDFGIYLNRTEDVPRFVSGLKQKRLIASNCSETLHRPPPNYHTSALLPSFLGDGDRSDEGILLQWTARRAEARWARRFRS